MLARFVQRRAPADRKWSAAKAAVERLHVTSDIILPDLRVCVEAAYAAAAAGQIAIR